jgi:hypothetical protein
MGVLSHFCGVDVGKDYPLTAKCQQWRFPAVDMTETSQD